MDVKPLRFIPDLHLLPGLNPQIFWLAIKMANE